ncbi:MAG: SET domain-containing protein-lysine N-methyltransferase [Anaerolineales bacterium]
MDILKFEIRSSPIQGSGAFALESIRKGTRLIEYTGERITSSESDLRYTNGKQSPVLLFVVDKRLVIDAGVNGNEARFINHSCDPNCEAVIDRRSIYIEAIRKIAPGEELTYDYNLTREEGEGEEVELEFVCNCGASNCRGTMLEPLPKSPNGAAKKSMKKKSVAKRHH